MKWSICGIDLFSIAHRLHPCNVKLSLSFIGRVNRRVLRLDERIAVSERL